MKQPERWDGLGLFPLFFAAANLSLDRIGILAALYPATWGIVQLGTGASDRVGRKWLIVTGMWVQAIGIAVVTVSHAFLGFATAAARLGIGTATRIAWELFPTDTVVNPRSLSRPLVRTRSEIEVHAKCCWRRQNSADIFLCDAYNRRRRFPFLGRQRPSHKMSSTSSVGATHSRRRQFLDRLLGIWSGGVLVAIFYPVIRYLVPPEIPEAATLLVTAGPSASLAANSARIVPFGSTPVIVVRTAAGELRAFAATCTHLACTVQYRPDLANIWCACHNGLYDLNGRNISGPPPSPLTTFDVYVKDDQIVIVRKA